MKWFFYFVSVLYVVASWEILNSITHLCLNLDESLIASKRSDLFFAPSHHITQPHSCSLFVSAIAIVVVIIRRVKTINYHLSIRTWHEKELKSLLFFVVIITLSVIHDILSASVSVSMCLSLSLFLTHRFNELSKLQMVF